MAIVRTLGMIPPTLRLPLYDPLTTASKLQVTSHLSNFKPIAGKSAFSKVEENCSGGVGSQFQLKIIAQNIGKAEKWLWWNGSSGTFMNHCTPCKLLAFSG